MTKHVEAFFAAWGDSDARTQAASVAACFAADGTYADPRTPEPLTGPSAVAEYVAMSTASAPGATATVVDTQAQHGVIRASVEFRMADGMVQHGQYFVHTDENGLLADLVGFVGLGVPASP